MKVVTHAIHVAATKKKLRLNHDWQPFFDIADKDLPYREKLSRYAKIARERMEAERFEEFCAKHLAHLDEVAWEFFGTDRARHAVRTKVEALFPKHEWDTFTEHFWNELQLWRQEDAAERAAAKSEAKAPKSAPKKSAARK